MSADVLTSSFADASTVFEGDPRRELRGASECEALLTHADSDTNDIIGN